MTAIVLLEARKGTKRCILLICRESGQPLERLESDGQREEAAARGCHGNYSQLREHAQRGRGGSFVPEPRKGEREPRRNFSPTNQRKKDVEKNHSVNSALRGGDVTKSSSRNVFCLSNQ